jgi:Glycosyltransferase family 87
MKPISEQCTRILNLSSFAYQAVIVLWGMLEIYLVGMLLAERRFFVDIQGNISCYCDFLSFYKCGKIVCSATPQLLYDFSTQMAWFNNLIAPTVTNTPNFSPYTPTFCLLMGTLSFCPIFWSYLIWMLGTVAFAFFALSHLLNTAGCLTKKERYLFLLAVFSSMPSWLTIREGQSSWLILGMAAFFISFFLRKNDFFAGLCLSLVAIKPQYFLFLIVPALAAKRYKIIASTIFWGVFQLLLAGFILGWETIPNYPKMIFFDENHIVQKCSYCGPEQMACLRGVLSLFTAPSFNFHFCFILMLAALPLLLRLWCRANSYSVESCCSRFSLTVLLALLLNPHVYFHDCLLLAIPAALSLKTLNPIKMAKYSRGGELLVFYCFFVYPLLGIMGSIVTALSLSNRSTNLGFFLLHSLILAGITCNLKVLVVSKTAYFPLLSPSWNFVKDRAASLSLTALCVTAFTAVSFFQLGEAQMLKPMLFAIEPRRTESIPAMGSSVPTKLKAPVDGCS